MCARHDQIDAQSRLGERAGDEKGDALCATPRIRGN
jgi:hypothetical protein